jgi:hypothetical protein
MTPSIVQPTRPNLAKSYGISSQTGGLMSWDWVEEQMTKANSYWIGTVWPNGIPHAVPVSGVWLNGALYFGGDRMARRSRNLAANPQVNVHLQSVDDVVIIQGTATEVTDQAELKVVADAVEAKFKMPLLFNEDTVLNKVTPQTVLAWIGEAFPTTATRWVFER